MSHYGPTGEYAQNLYTDAMGIVRNATGSNVYPASEYPNGIPLADVRSMFAAHEHAAYPSSYTIPGEADGVNDDGTIHYGPDTVRETGMLSWVRKSDGREHARYAADSGDKRRQSSWLLDTYASGLVGGADGMHVTAAGHTNNGGRAYLQLATGQILTPGGMALAPTLTLGLGHDGTLKVVGVFGGGIISCANMVGGILSSAKARTKQTKNITDDVILARHRVMLGLETVADTLTAEFERMAATVFTDAHWTATLDAVAPLVAADGSALSQHATTRNENTRATLTGMYRADERCAPWHGSLLGAFQTLDTHDSWVRGVRGDTDRHERMVSDFLSGTITKRQDDRAQTLARVMATV